MRISRTTIVYRSRANKLFPVLPLTTHSRVPFSHSIVLIRRCFPEYIVADVQKRLQSLDQTVVYSLYFSRKPTILRPIERRIVWRIKRFTRGSIALSIPEDTRTDSVVISRDLYVHCRHYSLRCWYNVYVLIYYTMLCPNPRPWRVHSTSNGRREIERRTIVFGI